MVDDLLYDPTLASDIENDCITFIELTKPRINNFLFRTFDLTNGVSLSVVALFQYAFADAKFGVGQDGRKITSSGTAFFTKWHAA